MKKILLYLCLLLASVAAFSIDAGAAGIVVIPGATEIQDVSLDIGSNWNAIADISNTWFRILRIAKRMLMGLMVIFMVYTGAMMIMSMGSDEEKLSSSKRQIWYAAVALVFINIPGALYEAFYKNGDTSVGWDVTNSFDDANVSESWNLFFDVFIFGNTLNNQIIFFLEVMVFLAAITMITIAGISLMTSRGREEKMKEAKNKILYTILALIFVGIIEAWKRVAFGWNISDGVNLFDSLANLALFFAAPIAIFFLTLAGYYFITSNGDEERVKKAKSIIINTILATLILLAAYTFLIDLATL
jgi:hypothetical protein